MTRSTRLFEVIQFMRQADGPVTAAQIAEALEVTSRTIYRDMAALQAMRLPIAGEAGIGYVMRSGFDLPPLMFTQDEMEAIIVGLSLLGRTGDRSLENSAKNAASKIAEVVPENVGKVAPLRVSKWTAIPESKITAGTLREFIREAIELRIDYLDLSDRQTTRNVKPLALLYYVDAVLVVAWCELRNAFRHFRIDRIAKCIPTGKNFRSQSSALVKQWEKENAARG